MGGLSGEANSGMPWQKIVLKVTETEAMKIVRREQERERKRKYRDSKKKLDCKRRASTGE